MKNRTNLPLTIYSAAHFLVDFGCALLILGRVCPGRDPAQAILLYNFFAFAVQMPVGLIADRLGNGHRFAAAGCALVLLSFLLPAGLIAAVTAGLGNAAFHVGGGLYVLNEKSSRSGPLGLFVSPGAFGIYLGSRFAFRIPQGPVLALLAASSTVLLFFGRGRQNVPLALPPKNRGLAGAVLCLVATVFLRSLFGLAADLSWKADAGAALVAAIAGGKAAGGFLSDRFGARAVALFSLFASALCFLFCGHPIPGLAALFFFNMTMPLTLRAAADLFPGMKGFSFGLLTFGLFLGFLPVFFGCGPLGGVWLALGSVLSLPPLLAGLRYVRRMAHDVC